MRLAILFLLSVLVPSLANAEARIALLIGNQRYSAKVGTLNNPHSDVLLVGAALKAVGFNVTEVKDADYRSTDAAIKRHIAAVRREGQGAISFVYYSGHGAADPDTKINYLVPVDVANADDAELWNYSINLNTLVENLRAQAPGATHYVVFDACRNELNLTRLGQKALTEKGFVPMAYTPGVLVAYATAPGRTASDRGTGGGPYAKALADEIVKPGVDSMLVFSRVARRVQHEIGQDPFLSASTMPEIYFAGNTPSAPSARPDRSELERAWEFIKETDDPARLEAFIRHFGDTPYAHMARARLEELKKKTAVAAPASTAGAQPQGTSRPPSVLKEKPEHGFDGSWGLRGAGNASCSLKTWRWTDPIQISRSQIVGRNGTAKGQVFSDGTFEITVHSRGVGRFKGKLKGDDGSGTYTWSDTGCSGSFVLHRR